MSSVSLWLVVTFDHICAVGREAACGKCLFTHTEMICCEVIPDTTGIIKINS